MDPFSPIVLAVVIPGAALWGFMFVSSWGVKITRAGDWFKGKDLD